MIAGVRVWILAAAAAAASAQTSEWVHFGPNHKLEYKTDAHGNRVMDFSYAGYSAGGVKLPEPQAAKTLTPAQGDNTPAIQAAIDEVSKLPLKDGFRGAVLLKPGTYELAGTLTIAASGVVLRGSGSGEAGTIVQLTGTPHRFLEIRGTGTYQTSGKRARITNDYVPSGARSFHVDDPEGFHAGDTVLVLHPVTEEWVRFMNMDKLVRDGKPQTWIKAGQVIRTDRTIERVDGKEITLDVPLSDSLDAQFLKPDGATLVKYTFPGRIAHSGVELLRVKAPFTDVPITGPQFTALRMDAVHDGWAKDIVVNETQNGITLGATSKRLTLRAVKIEHSAPHSGSAAPADFSISGTQILLDRCVVDGEGTWPVVTQATVTGPNVVLHFSGTAHAGVSPHQRWATGLLVDNLNLPNTVTRTPGIAFSNRKTMGSGHGWDVGWAVGWNVKTPYLLVQQPPGVMNWCIGCTGEEVKKDDPSGIFDSKGKAVLPESLYLEQLRERGR